jgi:4-amino-4-deoxy-L-arabinose transferase-like glycosyltransferase
MCFSKSDTTATSGALSTALPFFTIGAVSTDKTHSPAPAAASSSALTIERWLLVVLGGYFLLRAVVRTLVSDTPEWDEAEQLIQTQTWSLGYGPQPPLYAWVQKLIFLALGTNIFGLALFTALLRFGTFALTCVVGREVSGDRRVGVAAALSLFLIPQFVWYSQVDLTHSNMGMFLAVLTVLLVVRLLQQRTTARYVWFGLAVAAGLLSNDEYFGFFLVLVPVLLSLPEGRTVLADKRIAVSVGLVLVLLAPYLNWVAHNQGLALRRMSYLHSPGSLSWLRGWLAGFITLATSLLMYFVPLYAGWAVVLRRLPRLTGLWVVNDPERRVILFRRLLAFSVVLYVAAVFLLRAKFNERWIQLNMYALPLLLAAGFAAELTGARLKRFAALAGTVAVAVFLVLGGRVMLAGKTKMPLRQNLPYRELAEKLKRAGIQPATILAIAPPPGAVFRLEFPDARVLVPGQLVPETRPGPQLVIWDADANAHAVEMLRQFAAQRGIPPEAFDHASVVEAPMKYFETRKVSLNYFVVPESPESNAQTK